MLFKSNQAFELAQPGGGGASEPGASAPRPGYLGLFLMGVEHILTGYDHLVFLLGLVLIGGRLRSLLLVITAFTVAHSITLFLAATGASRLPAVVVESGIALSVVVVALNNVFPLFAEDRWTLAFALGLLHGFGFSNVLADLGLAHHARLLPLFGFNVGVELGQLAFIAVVLGVIALAKRLPLPVPVERNALPATTYALGGLAAFWFVERVAGFWI